MIGSSGEPKQVCIVNRPVISRQHFQFINMCEAANIPVTTQDESIIVSIDRKQELARFYRTALLPISCWMFRQWLWSSSADFESGGKAESNDS